MITRKWVTRHSTEDDETFPVYVELSPKAMVGELAVLGFVRITKDNLYRACVCELKETLCNSEAEGKEAVEEFCKKIPHILKEISVL